MELKRFNNFINEKVLIHNGDFAVTKNMVSNGKMIKEMIPREVTGDFECSFLELTSLEGGPELVGGDFDCRDNKLISLMGCPIMVDGNFDCGVNELTSLKGCTKEIGRSFECSFNKLITLEGGPSKVGGYYICKENKLTSLLGSPKEIYDGFYCLDNQLTSLEDGPSSVEGEFNALFNKRDLIIEVKYIKSDISKTNYWKGLLEYMIDKGIDLTEIETWPNEFINTLEPKYKNYLSTSKTINKFKL